MWENSLNWGIEEEYGMEWSAGYVDERHEDGRVERDDFAEPDDYAENYEYIEP